MDNNELLKSIEDLFDKKLKEELKHIKEDIKELKSDISIIKKMTEGISEQTHDLTEFRTSTTNEIQILRECQDETERKLTEVNNTMKEVFKAVADDIDRIEDENLQNHKAISQLRATLKRKEVI